MFIWNEYPQWLRFTGRRPLIERNALAVLSTDSRAGNKVFTVVTAHDAKLGQVQTERDRRTSFVDGPVNPFQRFIAVLGEVAVSGSGLKGYKPPTEILVQRERRRCREVVWAVGTDLAVRRRGTAILNA